MAKIIQFPGGNSNNSSNKQEKTPTTPETPTQPARPPWDAVLDKVLKGDGLTDANGHFRPEHFDSSTDQSGADHPAVPQARSTTKMDLIKRNVPVATAPGAITVTVLWDRTRPYRPALDLRFLDEEPASNDSLAHQGDVPATSK